MTAAAFINIAQVNFFLAASIQEFLSGVGIQLFPRSIQRKAKMLGDFLQHAIIIRTLTVPAADRALADADLCIRNQFLSTEMAACPQTVTDWASTDRKSVV